MTKTKMKMKTPGVYRRGAVFWIKYYVDGRPIRESVKGAVLGDNSIATGRTEREALRLLNLRKGNVERARVPAHRPPDVRPGDGRRARGLPAPTTGRTIGGRTPTCTGAS